MYVLHTRPDSAGVAVHLVLQELGLPFTLHVVSRDTGEHETPEYRALHPLGLVPALETPDGPMFETAAILLWLADRHKTLAPLPTDPDRAAFLTWYFFTSTNLHTTLMHLFFPDRYTGGPEGVSAFLKAAAARMGLTQPKVSDMMRGDFSNLSERKLMDCLTRLGYDIEITIRPAKAEVGCLVVV